jgi:uncharacterized protein (DUF427 family)
VWRGRTIGETTRALELTEAGYPPVAYIPREDVEMALLKRSTRVTSCPYKGEANYFSIADGYDRDDDAVWTYESPPAPVGEIAGHLAFYPNAADIVRAG